MSEQILVLTDEPVNVRDSWDLLETPRTSHSETDEFTTIAQKPNVSLRYDRTYQQEIEHKRIRKTEKQEKRNDPNMRVGTILNYKDKALNKKLNNATMNYDAHSSSKQRTPFQGGLLRTSETMQRSRPVSANSFPDAPKVIPKRYRKLGLRNHDDMLKEQFDQLRHLLNDAENMSKEELNRQHIEQTANMIADFKTISGGTNTKRVIISRSLPESLRPKSPRSSSASSLTSSRESHQTYRSYSSSRSPSPASRRSIKRVSFKTTSTQGKKHSGTSTATTTKGLKSTKSSSASKTNKEWYESPSAEELSDPPPSTASQSESSVSSDGEEPDSVAIPVGSTEKNRSHSNWTEKEPAVKSRSAKLKTQHPYISDNIKVSRWRRQRRDIIDEYEERTIDLQISRVANEQSLKCGIYEDSTGHKHSDNNLKRTSNPDVKRWLREKEKAIREMKKKQKQVDKQKEVAQQQDLEKKNERKAESDKCLREWQINKRKQARLLRRQNTAKRKIDKQKVSGSENGFAMKKGAENESSTHKPNVVGKPKAPTMPRPKSAPPSRRRPVKPQVPIAQVIKNSPDLQERLKQLEKQKRLKHRQSYEDWLKTKENEKRDCLKAVREKRKELEKEITEETAKLISEAAKRRIDNVQYKGSKDRQEEKSPKKEDVCQENQQPKQTPYRWRQSSEQTANTNPGASQHTASRTPNMSAQNRSKPTKHKARKLNVEEKISDTGENPFSDPFKPPKLHRPKSKLEQNGIKGPEFSRFIWELVNAQENGGNRPEPQGADSPQKSQESNNSPEKDKLKSPPEPKQSKSPTPPTDKQEASDGIENQQQSEPIIDKGKSIFSMTSIE